MNFFRSFTFPTENIKDVVSQPVIGISGEYAGVSKLNRFPNISLNHPCITFLMITCKQKLVVLFSHLKPKSVVCKNYWYFNYFLKTFAEQVNKCLLFYCFERKIFNHFPKVFSDVNSLNKCVLLFLFYWLLHYFWNLFFGKRTVLFYFVLMIFAFTFKNRKCFCSMVIDHNKYINIGKVVKYLENDLAWKLAHIHAITSCDTTSFMIFVGKVKFWKDAWNKSRKSVF